MPFKVKKIFFTYKYKILIHNTYLLVEGATILIKNYQDSLALTPRNNDNLGTYVPCKYIELLEVIKLKNTFSNFLTVFEGGFRFEFLLNSTDRFIVIGWMIKEQIEDDLTNNFFQNDYNIPLFSIRRRKTNKPSNKPHGMVSTSIKVIKNVIKLITPMYG